MKRYLLVLCLASALFLSPCLPASGWGRTGHKVVVAIAQRHLTERARQNIALIAPYDIREDASWMDDHRKDEEYAYTGSYHTMGMTREGIYDPTLRMPMGGDCVVGLEFVDYMLTHTEQLHLSDSAKLFHLRMAIHIVGDMHSLPHAYMLPQRNQWKCRLNGEDLRYHGFLDFIPDRMYPEMSIDDIVRHLDTGSKRVVRAAQKGSFVDWAQDCCTRDMIIYEVNPYGTYDLDPDSVEKLTPAIEDALRTAGYRLAGLLNKYFDR